MIDIAKQDKVTAKTLMGLIEHQEYKCALTGLPLTPQDASLDHIMPVSRGGGHVLGNVHIVHKQVNQAKGSLTMDEFISICRLVVERFEDYEVTGHVDGVIGWVGQGRRSPLANSITELVLNANEQA